MSQDCCQPKVTTMILACSGGSNVGQLSNQAAIELTQEGFGKLSCLAGVGAHLSGFVQSARDITELVVIDGCEVGLRQRRAGAGGGAVAGLPGDHRSGY